MPASKNKGHVIDPDGEVIFLLEDANAPFAVWDEEKINKPTPKKPAKKPPKKKAKLDESKEQVPIRVSAKHLMLASPVLKKTLSGGWKESELFAKKGSIELVVHDWDLEAFLLFLRIIHCQHKDLPKTVTLEMIAKIAVLADYYACKDSVHFFANLWIEGLSDDFPTTYSRESMLWLFVSWFFGRPTDLTDSTSLAMTFSKGPITNLDLPIPSKVLETLNKHREDRMKEIMDSLQKERERCLSKDWSCSFECCSMLLGALERQMHLKCLSSPKPTAPFLGLDYQTLVHTVRSIKVPKWAPVPVSGMLQTASKAHTCAATTRGYHLAFSPTLPGFETI